MHGHPSVSPSGARYNHLVEPWYVVEPYGSSACISYPIIHSTVMIKKKTRVKLNFPNLTTQEDFGLWLKLARKGFKLKHLNQTLSSWRDSENSLSSSTFSKFKDAFKLYYIYEKKNLTSSFFSVLVLSYNKLIKYFN